MICFRWLLILTDFAKSKKLEVVYVTGNGVVDNRQKFFATIPEWLYLVDNAEYVITNSFHCGVFCTIFGTKFAVIPLCGIHTGMNVRFDSLFKLRGIEQRFLTDDFSVVEKEFVAKDVNVSKKFLEELK
ncbi:polysaccharide pyruvyl transferase family protein [Treponema berlinense]|uniref:polysaccharide pyruvyl transferase family protein n=1 Tax=Treponema berlinense TaxID=225004 RepID=UPI003FD8263B